MKTTKNKSKVTKQKMFDNLKRESMTHRSGGEAALEQHHVGAQMAARESSSFNEFGLSVRPTGIKTNPIAAGYGIVLDNNMFSNPHLMQ